MRLARRRAGAQDRRRGGEATGRTAMTYEYTRYLAAKKTVDDRALNRSVLTELRRLIPPGKPRILEIGAGLGTMAARLLEWGVVSVGEYTLLDVDPQLLRDARAWLGGWATARGLPTEPLPDGLRVGDLRVRLGGGGAPPGAPPAEPLPDGLRVGDLRVRLVEAELGGYLDAGRGEPADVLIANAFLDLVDVPAVLPGLLRLLAPGGVYWFTINFDGESIFSPDHPRDDDVLQAYHRSMDERVRFGRPGGESRAGRHLFASLCAAAAPPLAAGSSDWVVHAAPDGTYPDDERFFMESILRTIEDALTDRVEPAVLAGWVAARRRQLAAGALVYIAHQLDFVGRTPGAR